MRVWVIGCANNRRPERFLDPAMPGDGRGIYVVLLQANLCNQKEKRPRALPMLCVCVYKVKAAAAVECLEVVA